MRHTETLTQGQAQDLARYFLGSGWYASIGMSTTGNLYSLSGYARTCSGASWREAFRKAGVRLPSIPRHFVNGCNVSFNNQPVCVAISANTAKRIANALDAYTPSKKGI